MTAESDTDLVDPHQRITHHEPGQGPRKCTSGASKLVPTPVFPSSFPGPRSPAPLPNSSRRRMEDQVALLSMELSAEAAAFAAVVSAVWHEAVDEAARLLSREHRQAFPGVLDALAEVAVGRARPLILDGLVDECLLELTGPGGELSQDGRAAAAVAEGLTHRVRDAVADEIIDATLEELVQSGEARELVRRKASTDRLDQQSDVDTSSHVGNQAEPSAGEVTPGEREGSESTWPKDSDWTGENDEGGGPSQGDWVTKGIGTSAGPSRTSGPAPPYDPKMGLAPAWPEDEARFDAEASETRPANTLSQDGSASLRGASSPDPPPKINVSRGTAAPDHAVGSVVDPSATTFEERAVIVIQSAFRRGGVYRRIRRLIARNFVKLYDPSSGCFYWYNQSTGQSTWEKPAIVAGFFGKAGGTA